MEIIDFVEPNRWLLGVAGITYSIPEWIWRIPRWFLFFIFD